MKNEDDHSLKGRLILQAKVLILLSYSEIASRESKVAFTFTVNSPRLNPVSVQYAVNSPGL